MIPCAHKGNGSNLDFFHGSITSCYWDSFVSRWVPKRSLGIALDQFCRGSDCAKLLREECLDSFSSRPRPVSGTKTVGEECLLLHDVFYLQCNALLLTGGKSKASFLPCF